MSTTCRTELGLRTPSQSPMDEREPSIWTLICCLPKCRSRKLYQKQVEKQAVTPDPLKGDAGALSIGLTCCAVTPAATVGSDTTILNITT